MKTLLITLLGVALVTSVGFASFLYLKDPNNEDLLQSATAIPYITYVDGVLVDDLILQLKGQTDDTQLSLIQYFILQQRKFLNADVIVKILAALNESFQKQVQQHAIIVMKPYIAPLNMNETCSVLNELYSYNGIASSVVISQLYDFNKQQDSYGCVMNALVSMNDQNLNLFLWPQFNKRVQHNFLITSEGRHVGFVFDQSENMNVVAYRQADGTNITRYGMLHQFYWTSKDIFSNFYALSYILTGNITKGYCLSSDIIRIEQMRQLNAFVDNNTRGGGENDIYSKLAQLLTQPYSYPSDVYIWSTGIITAGTQDLNDFIKLIDETNSQARSKIRINTVSFLVGGSEPQLVKSKATYLLQSLADYTGGTFIQIYPQLN